MTPLQLCKDILVLILIFGSISRGFGFVTVIGDSGFFSVCDYGAIGDGITEDTGVMLFPVNIYPLDLVYNFFSHYLGFDIFSHFLQAFLEAWQATCSTQFKNPTMIIPDNYTFLLHQLTFSGPCNAKNITFLVYIYRLHSFT